MTVLTIRTNEITRSSRILVDGEEVGSADYDSHGWQGMEDMEALAVRIAEKMGWQVVREDEPDEEESAG